MALDSDGQPSNGVTTCLHGHDDHGTFGVMVNATTGNAIGFACSTGYSQMISLSGQSPTSLDQSHSFVSGTVGGATFSGQFNSASGLSGTWTAPAASGTFTGQRVGGLQNAIYRFTGKVRRNRSRIDDLRIAAASDRHLRFAVC